MARSDKLFGITRRVYLRPGGAVEPLHWRPRADIYRTERGWLVKFELAGVQEEEVEVVIAGRRLLLRGRRLDIDLIPGCRSQSMEIAYSRFERVVELPVSSSALESAPVETVYRRGMFLVHIITEEGGS